VSAREQHALHTSSTKQPFVWHTTAAGAGALRFSDALQQQVAAAHAWQSYGRCTSRRFADGLALAVLLQLVLPLKLLLLLLLLFPLIELLLSASWGAIPPCTNPKLPSDA
jgi:hypothetical protein